ncbi:MAG: site-specific integrase [Lachnospiraceae bacterium]|nr:site-specific integrase [Lachnospiraceae bacterium]
MQKTENLKNESYRSSEKTALTFSALYQEWLESCKSEVKESTYAQYRIYARNHLLPYFGENAFAEITSQEVRAFVHCKLNTLKQPDLPTYSASTVRLMLSILKLIFQYARLKGYDMDANLVFPRLQESRARRKVVLTVEEQTRLTKTLNASPHTDAVGILLSLYTGLRIGEVCALRWKEIDLDNRCIQIKYTLQRISVFDPQSPQKTKLVMSYPKSRKSLRDVPIPLFLIEKLSGICPEDREAYLLTGSREAYLEPRTLENRFHKYALDCELSQVHFHMCRHSFATRCLEKGVDIKTLSEILGHSSVKITLDRYTHTSFDLKLTNVDKLTFLN